MSLALGRKGWIGLGKETTPGVPVTPSVNLPFTEINFQDKHEPLGDNAAKGLRNKEYQSAPGKVWGEGSFTMNLDTTLIGHVLLWGLGTVNSSVVSGSIKDHTFTRNNSNTPQTYSLHFDRTTDRELFPYATCKALELNFTDGLVTAKADLISQAGVTTTSGSLTVTSGILFAWKDATVQFGTTLTTADIAATTKVSELTLTIENNSVPSWRSGVQNPASIDHGSFRVYGSFKVYFEDTTQLTYFKNLTKQAMIVKFNGTRDIGPGYQERLTVNLPLIRHQDVVIDTPLDDFNVAVFTFEAEYDPVTTKTIDMVLRNLTSSY